ncbi:protein CHUP1, chloroplastic-like [Cucurbita moschata]|uniref:Protein CHUP1, chloroplastic-like n=1 Tax=Cucurbita moschata TaxID=3662 RepID=A0A6J1ECG5_CUCMO|nr:protein CHUP1, chloroplastic-like [Cucurbita moschata]XP_022925728.1 protein CHUP1, chloroplastic-like [Cucurbita moschata]
MKEDNPSESRGGKPSRFADQNHNPNPNPNPKSLNHNAKGTTGNASKFRAASSWGSNIVKGFSTDKRTKTTLQPKKPPPLATSDFAYHKDKLPPSQSRIKRSLIGDSPCSPNPAQVHPHSYHTHRRQSSRDLFVELDQLRTLLNESKNREFELQNELAELKRNTTNYELERELEEKKAELDALTQKLNLLEEDRRSLSQQLVASSSISEKQEEPQTAPLNIEVEVVELRRLNKELQLQKRNLACRLSSVESELACVAKSSESEGVAKIKAEASLLRQTNEDLCKQVEGLQMSRLNEVEELAYLRWVNSCLRNELRNSCPSANSNSPSSPQTIDRTSEAVGSLSSQKEHMVDCNSAKRINLIKKLKKWPITDEELSNLDCSDNSAVDKNWVDTEEGRSPRRRHSISGAKCWGEELEPNKRRQSDGFICAKEMDKEADPLSSQTNRSSASLDVEKRALRVPNPPPRPSCSISNEPKDENTAIIPPPLPPPPPPPPLPKFAVRSATGMVQRAPQVVEFYHSLMKRDSRRDSSHGAMCNVPDVSNVRSSMIGEIENRSSHLLAIKADIETQGEFVNSLIREVNNAVYLNIEDVVAFVKWLDDELCFLVDERAVLKHFDWPERKADTLREAAFGYRDLKKLECEISGYKDDPRLPCDIALKKMVSLSEKMERSIYNLLRMRESLMRHCKEFQIPTDWMLDNGIISKIKLGSVKLAKMYMKRVAMELQSKASSEKDPAMDYMLLQGVRFAFRIHQFAGGLDADTMHAFEDLRNLANLLNKK